MNKSQIIAVLRYALVILGGGLAGAGMGSQLDTEPVCPPPPSVVEVAPVVPEAPVAPPAEPVGIPE